jgi:hypothetical protein
MSVLGRAGLLVVIVGVHFDEAITPITIMVVAAANFEVGIATKVEHFTVVRKPICKSLAITELLIVIAIEFIVVDELTIEVVRVDPTIYSLASSVAIVIIVGWSVIEISATEARTAIITIEAVIAASSASVAIACLTMMVT